MGFCLTQGKSPLFYIPACMAESAEEPVNLIYSVPEKIDSVCSSPRTMTLPWKNASAASVLC